MNVKLLCVPYDASYENVQAFSTAAERQETLAISANVESVINVPRLFETDGTGQICFPKPHDDIEIFNYIEFTDEGGRRSYAFIDYTEPKSEASTILHYVCDVWQTFAMREENGVLSEIKVQGVQSQGHYLFSTRAPILEGESVGGTISEISNFKNISNTLENFYYVLFLSTKWGVLQLYADSVDNVPNMTINDIANAVASNNEIKFTGASGEIVTSKYSIKNAFIIPKSFVEVGRVRKYTIEDKSGVLAQQKNNANFYELAIRFSKTINYSVDTSFTSATFVGTYAHLIKLNIPNKRYNIAIEVNSNNRLGFNIRMRVDASTVDITNDFAIDYCEDSSSASYVKSNAIPLALQGLSAVTAIGSGVAAALNPATAVIGAGQLASGVGQMAGLVTNISNSLNAPVNTSGGANGVLCAHLGVILKVEYPYENAADVTAVSRLFGYMGTAFRSVQKISELFTNTTTFNYEFFKFSNITLQADFAAQMSEQTKAKLKSIFTTGVRIYTAAANNFRL